MAKPCGRTEAREEQRGHSGHCTVKAFSRKTPSAFREFASGYILQSPQGKPLNLDALARDVIRPAFEAAKLPWYIGSHFKCHQNANYGSSMVKTAKIILFPTL
jgi:hypothetical protein